MMNHPTILIVDDEMDIVATLAFMLEHSGYAVRKAYGGEEALQSVAREKPDAILLDLMMPDLDGTEVIRRLHADPGTASIPVVIITATAQLKEFRDSGQAIGAAGFIEKPFQLNDLLLKLREVFPAQAA